MDDSLISEDQIRELLAKKIEEAEGQGKLGRCWRIEPSYISLVVNGRRKPGPCILDALGYEMVPMYRRKNT